MNIKQTMKKYLNERIKGKDIEKAVSNIDNGINVLSKYFKKKEPAIFKEYEKIADEFLIWLENHGVV